MLSHRSLLLACFFFLFSVRIAFACDVIACDEFKGDDVKYFECLSTNRQCLQTKIAEVQSQKATLNSTISIINNKISLQELSISQTLAEITKLEKDIDLLGERIDTLNFSLDQLTSMLLKRVRERYKSSVASPLTVIANSQSFSELITSSRYISRAGVQTAIIMRQAELQKQLFDLQKEKKEAAQLLLEQKRKLLEQQKRELASQKAGQQKLLEVTKNNEKNYQQLLASAQAEIAGFKNYSSSKTGGILPAQQSPDGWFFSQRDERWGGQTIANSSESILDVGCLITSTAMIKKKFGEDVTPLSIANNASYFFGSTAYMLRPWPAPAGYRYESSAYSYNLLEQKVKENPVVIKLAAGPYGTHFIVIKESRDGQFIMHDPWEGYDKNFTDFYNLGQIINISYLVRR